MVGKKEKAAKFSIIEGSFASVGANTGGSFITPFTLAIGGNSFHVGLMSSLSGLLNPLGQVKGSKLMEKYPRKNILRVTKLTNAIVYIFIASLAYLFWKGLLVEYLPYVLIMLWAILLHFFWGIGHVGWFSWMGDLIPRNIRGKYFAKRNRITGFVGLITFIVGAIVLDIFKTKGYLLLGFGILFGLSVIFRLSSRYLVGRIYEPKLIIRKKAYFSIWNFIKTYDNFGKFAFFQAMFYFSIMLATPFFAVYILEDLGFSYITYTAVMMSATVFYLLFAPLAGKFSDKYGNVKLLWVAGLLFPLVPLLWIFLENPFALIFGSGLIAGFANAALILGITDFTYDAVSPQRRGFCVAYTSVLVGLGVFFGSLIGGIIIQYIPITFIEPTFFVFGLSAFMILLTVLFFLPQIKDERKIDRIKGLSLDVSHPFRMMHSDVVWFKNFIWGRK